MDGFSVKNITRGASNYQGDTKRQAGKSNFWNPLEDETSVFYLCGF
jgi:hypothetical protein